MPRGLDGLDGPSRPADAERLEFDFETLGAGKSLPTTVGNASAGGKARILITRETAAGGRQSLKLVDDPDAPAP